MEVIASLNINNSITPEQLKEAAIKIKAYGPFPIEMQVYKKGYDALKKILLCDQTNIIQFKSIFGLKLVEVSESNDFKEHQARIINNDGSSKIINIFKLCGEETNAK